DFLGFDESVEQKLKLDLLLSLLANLCSVLVVLKTTLTLKVTVHFFLNKLLGDRDTGLLDERCSEEVACLLALRKDRGAARLLLEAFAQLVDRVKLACELSELIVSLGQLTLLDCGQRDGNLRVAALVLAAEQL